MPLLILLLGYGLLWRYRLVFLVPALPSTLCCCVHSTRLEPEKWEEPSYPEEPGPGYPGGPGHGGYGLWDAGETQLRWNPYADNTPLPLRQPAAEDSPGKENLEGPRDTTPAREPVSPDIVFLLLPGRRWSAAYPT